ncbi:MAG: type II toxin-antitoxin system VapC family toxin [Candidatus Cyclobacteriaceae bacterium M3_2C_046]
MENILVDAGPLIALFSKRDSYHITAIKFFKNFKGLLFTTWPVITETSHMLDFSVKAQINLLEWIERGGLNLININDMQISRMIQLCQKYDDVPMDLVDASLILAGEHKNISKIASIDAYFYIYHNIRNQYLTNIFPTQ